MFNYVRFGKSWSDVQPQDETFGFGFDITVSRMAWIPSGELCGWFLDSSIYQVMKDEQDVECVSTPMDWPDNFGILKYWLAFGCSDPSPTLSIPCRERLKIRAVSTRNACLHLEQYTTAGHMLSRFRALAKGNLKRKSRMSLDISLYLEGIGTEHKAWAELN